MTLVDIYFWSPSLNQTTRERLYLPYKTKERWIVPVISWDNQVTYEIKFFNLNGFYTNTLIAHTNF